METNQRSPRPWNIAASLVTVAVILLVGVMNRVTLPTPDWWDVSALPAFHAILNSIAAILILLGGVLIKAGRKVLHRNMMMGAFAVSTIFLLSYVTYHFTSDHTYYGDVNHDGILSEIESIAVAKSKPFYLTLLFSHIALAVVSFPLILFSIIAAVFHQFDRHKTLTRWAYPMWLFVATTGPVIYFLISPYY